MNADILHVTQKIDLDSGVMLNSIQLRLPNGAEITLEIDEANLLTLIRAKRGGEAQEELVSGPSPVASPAPVTDDTEWEEDNEPGAVMFGGDAATAPEPPAPPPQPAASLRGPRVPANEYGYPAIAARGRDVYAESTDVSVDEDGVPSI